MNLQDEVVQQFNILWIIVGIIGLIISFFFIELVDTCLGFWWGGIYVIILFKVFFKVREDD